MIELYTGTPGSGKSLHCAKEIYTRIRRGKNVIANFDINMSVFKKRKKLGRFIHVDNSDLNPQGLIDFALAHHRRNTNGRIIEGQTLVIIDECQILFNSRDWQAKDRMKWATFFTQHRKYGFNIILITQFDRLIDRQIRSLVEYQVIHRKASNYKTIGFFIGLLFGGNFFVAVTQWYGVREKMGSEFFVLRQKYAHLYDSYKIFGGQTEPGTAPARGPGAACPPKTVASSSAQPDETAEIEQNIIKTVIAVQQEQAQKKEGGSPEKYSSFNEFWLKQSS